MELMASGLSPQMVWAFCKAVWQSLLCHWSRPSTPCLLGLEWEWINQMVWERSAYLMHFVSRSTVIQETPHSLYLHCFYLTGIYGLYIYCYISGLLMSLCIIVLFLHSCICNGNRPSIAVFHGVQLLGHLETTERGLYLLSAEWQILYFTVKVAILSLQWTHLI